MWHCKSVAYEPSIVAPVDFNVRNQNINAVVVCRIRKDRVWTVPRLGGDGMSRRRRLYQV